MTEPIQWGNLSIRVRYDRYLVKTDQVRAGLVDLWNGHTQKPEAWDTWTDEVKMAWVDQGWLYTTNLPPWDETNITFEALATIKARGVENKDIWMFYNVTDYQTGDRATDDRVKYWKGVAGNTNTFKIFRNGVEVDPKEL
jgi:hypothetical protein